MQELRENKGCQPYLGPASGERTERGYWHEHPSDFRNCAISVQEHPSNRINIDIEARVHGDCDATEVDIYLYVVEIGLANFDREQASALLRAIAKSPEPVESWLKQVIPHSSKDRNLAWRIPGGAIQVKLHEGSYMGEYVVLVRLQHGNESFFQMHANPDLDVSKVPSAAVWSKALPRAV